MVNTSVAVLWQARTNPEKLAIVYKDQRISFADLADRLLKLADFQ